MADPLTLVNSTGFPLQLAIEHRVKESESNHGWKVTSPEHPWGGVENPRFLDLVLSRGAIYLAIECKRHRDGQWAFLVPDPPGRRAEKRRWYRAGHLRNEYSSDGRRAVSSLRDFELDPVCWESSFCAVTGASEGDRTPMLDRIGAELTQGADALLQQLLFTRGRNDHYRHREMPESEQGIVLPVIVTSADLSVCLFDPAADVSLDRGEIGPAAKIEKVHEVRYRKSFDVVTTRTPDSQQRVSDLETLREYSERTVSIVAAEHLVEWLKDINVVVFAIGSG
jgi:hypothetical protein